MATYLKRTSATTGNRRKFCFSTWIKRGDMNDNRCVFSQCSTSTYNSNTHFRMRFGTGSNLMIAAFGSDLLTTTRVFRDIAAWYHIVLAVDTTLATADDRIKLYINGVQETVFSTRNNPAQNFDTGMNLAASIFLLGADDSSAGTPSAMIMSKMSHTYLTDGYCYAASDFGETDSASGIWVPKLSASVSYGTNGFLMKYAPGALLTDSSGNGNNLSLIHI